MRAHFLRRIDNKLCVFDSTGWYDDALIRTPRGWRIKDRVSRMMSANGDHRVMRAMPDVDTNFRSKSLAEEAEAGRVLFFGGARG